MSSIKYQLLISRIEFRQKLGELSTTVAVTLATDLLIEGLQFLSNSVELVCHLVALTS